MIFLELDWAVFQRLTGAPLDKKGRPQLDQTTHEPVNRSWIKPPDHGGGFGPSWGVRIPELTRPHDVVHALSTNDQDALRLFKGYSPDSYRQIPVFDENLEGRKWVDIWPCVTFRWVVPTFDETTYIYYDSFSDFDPNSPPVDIVNEDGDVVQSGHSARIVRPTPDSYKVQYVITAQAKNKIEIALLCAQILYLFPARGGITVEWASGEKHTCDVLLKNTGNLDVQGNEIAMSLGLEEQRFYKRTFTYDIEAYIDNTTNKYGTPAIIVETDLIYQRILELQNMQANLARFSLIDLNAIEA